MLSRATFNKLIDYIIKQDERENTLETAMRGYFEDKDFTSIFDSRFRNIILNTLMNEMHDSMSDSIIMWWLFDAPDHGNAKDDSYYDITEENGEVHTIKTSDDLYDYLLENMTISDLDEEMAYAYQQQTEGCKFAIKVLDDIMVKNIETNNDGVEDRDSLIRFCKNKIRDEYMLETNSTDDPAPEFPLKMSLITKMNRK